MYTSMRLCFEEDMFCLVYSAFPGFRIVTLDLNKRSMTALFVHLSEFTLKYNVNCYNACPYISV